MIYLYIKTHNITGLKYLGKTERNPETYQGSGKYWCRHIKKHSYDVTTEVIYQSENKEDIKSAGIYYSLFYDVVKSKQWANLIEEKGDGISKEFAIKENKRRIKDGTHNFSYEYRCKEQQRRVLLKTHNFCNSVLQTKRSIYNNTKRIKEGTHNFQFQWICEYCNKQGKNQINYLRWHGINCKDKK